MNKSFISLITILCTLTVLCYGQQLKQAELAEEFWYIEAENYELTDYKRKESLQSGEASLHSASDVLSEAKKRLQ